MGVGVGPRVGFNRDMESKAIEATKAVVHRHGYVGFSASARRRGQGQHAVAIVDKDADRVDDYVGKRLGIGVYLYVLNCPAHLVSGRQNPEHGVVIV